MKTIYINPISVQIRQEKTAFNTELQQQFPLNAKVVEKFSGGLKQGNVVPFSSGDQLVMNVIAKTKPFDEYSQPALNQAIRKIAERYGTENVEYILPGAIKHCHLQIPQSMNVKYQHDPFREVKAVSFTGHRPKILTGNDSRLAYDQRFHQSIVSDMQNRLKSYVENGYSVFITGGAQGIDQDVFFAVENLKKEYPDRKIKNLVYVPVTGQESKWRKTGLFGQEMYRQMLSLADEALLCSGSPYTPKLMNDRNEAMINDSDCLIAIWNGKPSGTGHAVNFAKSKKCETEILNFQIQNGLCILHSDAPKTSSSAHKPMPFDLKPAEKQKEAGYSL